jgi:hypothetical protein
MYTSSATDNAFVAHTLLAISQSQLALLNFSALGIISPSHIHSSTIDEGVTVLGLAAILLTTSFATATWTISAAEDLVHSRWVEHIGTMYVHL